MVIFLEFLEKIQNLANIGSQSLTNQTFGVLIWILYLRITFRFSNYCFSNICDYQEFFSRYFDKVPKSAKILVFPFTNFTFAQFNLINNASKNYTMSYTKIISLLSNSRNFPGILQSSKSESLNYKFFLLLLPHQTLIFPSCPAEVVRRPHRNSPPIRTLLFNWMMMS